MRLYTTSDCSGSVAATGSAAAFASPGLTVSVANDSTTTFHATATDAAGNTSACSTSSITYVEDSTPPAEPTLTDTDPDSPANDNSPEVKGTRRGRLDRAPLHDLRLLGRGGRHRHGRRLRLARA